MKHSIIIPDFFDHPRLGAMSRFSRSLMILPVFDNNVSVVCDNDILRAKVSHILSDRPRMANKNGGLQNLFMIDDHVFLIVDTDNPTRGCDKWIPYYSKYVSAFFVACHRHSTLYIFDGCSIPVFPLGLGHDLSVPGLPFEYRAHYTAMTTERDISVFFRGRYNTRLTRKIFSGKIQKAIPDTCISNSGDHKRMHGEKYIRLMGRSKIAWCPRSVKAPPDYECNSVTGRDSEAMCLECLVVRPSIGIIEVEKRVAGVHFVEYENDGSNLIEKLRYYLEHNDERKEIAHNGRLWWERNWSTVARAQQIFADCLEAIKQKK